MNTNQVDKQLRHDWRQDEVAAILQQPFNDLLLQAHTIHRQCFDANEIQVSSLLSIKTGSCSEDCAYCSQSAHSKTGVPKTQMIAVDDVVKAARAAKNSGATRFCMGSTGRSPKEADLPMVKEMIRQVKALGLETCVTLGMLNNYQAQTLKQAGLDYYNHNIDTSPEFYDKIITTHRFEDRLQTLQVIQNAGINLCSGGIIGMGESQTDRVRLLLSLANLPKHPQSVPINMLVPVAGTPLADIEPLHPLDFVRTVATARILMPQSQVRLSAGRAQMSDEMQALCVFAGANSIFYGDKLLTTENKLTAEDQTLFSRLGIRPSHCN